MTEDAKVAFTRPPVPPPHPGLRACVVVPARDEEALVGSCLEALAGQEGVSPEEYEVLLVLDRCADATEERALGVAEAHPALRLRLLEGPGRGAGHARRVGMEEAYARLLWLSHPGGLIASTDADTVVAPDWLRLQLQAAAGGARAIGGRIELRDGAGGLPDGVLGWRDEQGRRRRRELLSASGGEVGEARIEHWQFSGASLSLTAETYGEIGGLEPRAALEDEYLERALERRGIPIERPLAVRVTTSARTVGRAKRGLARDLALASWVRSNTHDARDFTLQDLVEAKHASGETVSVVVSAGGKGSGTAALLEALGPLAEAGLVDETIVLRPAGEPEGAYGAFGGQDGVEVHEDADLMPHFGPVSGYGDALWRGLSAVRGGIVVYLDPGIPDPGGTRIVGLLGPLLQRESLHFVKGYSEGPDGAAREGAALSELVARPLLNLYRPELAGFVDPLSAEFAARRPLLISLPFPAGYGASLSLLLDAAEEKGVAAVAQTRLGEGPWAHAGVPMADLSEAAYAVVVAATARAHGDDPVDGHAPGPLFVPLGTRPEGFTRRRVTVEVRPPLLGSP